MQVHHTTDGSTVVIRAEVLIIDQHKEVVGLADNCDKELLAWRERHLSFPLFMTPAAYLGVTHNTVLIETRIEVEDNIFVSVADVEMKCARLRSHTSDVDYSSRFKIFQLPKVSYRINKVTCLTFLMHTR